MEDHDQQAPVEAASEKHASRDSHLLSNKLSVLALGIIAVILIGGGYYFGAKASKQNLPSAKVQEQPSIIPITDPTVVWKTFKFVDSTGFGYELKTRANWSSTPFGGEANPEPKELAQNIFKSCAKGTDLIQIVHYKSSDTQARLNALSQKKNGFTSSVITTQSGLSVEKFSADPAKLGHLDQYVQIDTPRGYFIIFGRGECSTDFPTVFDQILSTFKLTQ